MTLHPSPSSTPQLALHMWAFQSNLLLHCVHLSAFLHTMNVPIATSMGIGQRQIGLGKRYDITRPHGRVRILVLPTRKHIYKTRSLTLFKGYPSI